MLWKVPNRTKGATNGPETGQPCDDTDRKNKPELMTDAATNTDQASPETLDCALASVRSPSLRWQCNELRA
ncbi:MAG: hypothetical protein KatS3mg015_3119 [Fimbriimonadales bacterium]|nr:MAG: hypothetical protein KatS3mg015_3119 [Fimbriimonadales bacterium]